jgi:hypothetical protein
MLRRLLLILGFLFVSACSAIAPAPTATNTALPTETITPTSTSTSTPTETAVPATETPDVLASLVPHGTPDALWNELPIMPGALAGEGEASGYRFTIKAERDDIEAYYVSELEKLGWQKFASGESPGGSYLIFFAGPQGSLSVSILPHGDDFIVMLVK